MASRIQYRRDTASNWTSENPVLAQGEPGYETDTGKEKIGDGSTAWTSLAYAGGGSTTLLGLTDVSGDGTNGQVLTTDGAAAFSFTTVSSGSSTLLGLTDVVSDGTSGQMLTTDGAGSFSFTTTNIGNDLTDVNSVTSQSSVNMELVSLGGSLTLKTSNTSHTVLNRGSESEAKLTTDTITAGNVFHSTYDAGTLTSNWAPDLHNGAHQKVLWHGDIDLLNPTNVGADGETGTITITRDQDNIVNGVGTNWIRQNINGTGAGSDLTNLGDSSVLTTTNIDVTVIRYTVRSGKLLYTAERHGPFNPS
tara:strand:- start:140 stop:1057 length:918 start_codon:yes stop_codon:yes gene_type:complete